MGLSIPQYFNEYTAVKGYGPVHTGARWVFPLNPNNSLDLDTRYMNPKLLHFLLRLLRNKTILNPKKRETIMP